MLAAQAYSFPQIDSMEIPISGFLPSHNQAPFAGAKEVLPFRISGFQKIARVLPKLELFKG